MPRCRRNLGFTKVEFLVVVAIVVFFGVLVGACISNKKHAYSRMNCASNLKEIGVAEEMFQNNHNSIPPWSLPVADGGTLEYCASGEQTFRHFQAQSNYIVAMRTLICPQDARQAATNWEGLTNTNVSYFVGLDSNNKLPRSILAGDRNITSSSSVILEASQSALPSWIKSVGLHGDKGHLLFGDGHVEEVDSAGLSNAVQRTGIATNRFAVP
jgi:prepilin-type processing-associated H-X9-DG protein